MKMSYDSKSKDFTLQYHTTSVCLSNSTEVRVCMTVVHCRYYIGGHYNHNLKHAATITLGSKQIPIDIWLFRMVA